MARLVLSGVVELLGVVAIVWGIALFCVPAAVIVGGLALLVIGRAIDPPPPRQAIVQEEGIKQ